MGGFKFDELKQIIHTQFQEFQDRIILIENEHYKEYGSGYSLYLGLNAIKNFTYDDLVFAEGDLWVDDDSFNHIWKTTKNVVTYTNEIILANNQLLFTLIVNITYIIYLIQHTLFWKLKNLF